MCLCILLKLTPQALQLLNTPISIQITLNLALIVMFLQVDMNQAPIKSILITIKSHQIIKISSKVDILITFRAFNKDPIRLSAMEQVELTIIRKQIKFQAESLLTKLQRLMFKIIVKVMDIKALFNKILIRIWVIFKELPRSVKKLFQEKCKVMGIKFNIFLQQDMKGTCIKEIIQMDI